MVSTFVNNIKGTLLISALWLGALLYGPTPAAVGQSPDTGAIRVESNDVLVPVLVLDKKRVAHLQDMNPYVFEKLAAANDYRALEDIVVRGLKAGDFRLWDDGHEMTIHHITFEAISEPFLPGIVTRFYEFVGIGRGIWAVPYSNSMIPKSSIVNPYPVPALSGYVLAYAPPASPVGGCNHVSLKVNYPKALVYFRDEYCGTGLSAADPLKGTKLGNRLRSLIDSKKKAKTKLSVATFAPLAGASARASPVRLYIDFPEEPLRGECNAPLSGAIAILGALYSRPGAAAVHFSDVAWKDTSIDWAFGSLNNLIPGAAGCGEVVPEPDQYRTQMELAPGQYDLRIVLIDGQKFGRAETTIVVEGYDRKHLAISGIALARRFRSKPGQSRSARTVLPSVYSPLVAQGTELMPPANKHFNRTDPFYFYFELYEPQKPSAQQATVEAWLRIVNPETGAVVRQLDPVNAASFRTPGNPVIPIGGGIDINNLPPGSYRLEARATDSSGESTPWRSVHFAIE